MTLAAAVVRWIERVLVHGAGDYLGQPFRLEPWQQDFLTDLYATDDGIRRVRRALMVLPKGNGKTELIAAICLVEFCGPSQLVDGKPRPRINPDIPIAAASYEQAARLFDAAKTMALESELAAYVEPYRHELRLKDRPGRMYKVAAVAGTNDGSLPTAFAADEIHEWVGSKERVHLIIANSLAKRSGGLELNITTPDDADPTSLLGRMFDYGQKVNAGEIDDPSFLFRWHHAEDHWNLDDPDELRAATAEANQASWLDVDNIVKRYEIDKIPEHEYRRYHLAQFVRSEVAFLPAGAWRDLRISNVLPPDGSDIVAGFDGSYSRDSTALVGCTSEGSLFVLGLWEKPDGVREWLVPRGQVDDAVDRMFARWNVTAFACDPHRWTSEIESWRERYGEVVVGFNTASPVKMIPACGSFYAAVLQGDVVHDGNPALARHFANAVIKERGDGIMITKESVTSPRKIDLAIAAILAYYHAVVLPAEATPAPFEVSLL